MRAADRFRRRVAPAALALATVLAVGCEGRLPTPVGDATDVPLRVTFSAVGTPVATLVVTVTAADIVTPLVFNLTVANGVASGTIRVPPGSARTITVTAMDTDGNVTHDGSVTLDVRPGQNPPVQVNLVPRAGQVPITVTFGSYGVVVTPAAATIEVDSQVQLTVVVTDANGAAVANPAVAWATVQPALAKVSGSGLVSGVAAGTVTIVASYEGVAGLSTVTVTSTVGQAPSIVLSATSANFEATAGGANAGGATIQITNGGGGTLEGLAASVTYGASQPTGWLTATLSGTTAPSTLTLSATTGALNAGTYTAVALVSASGAGNTPQSVAVTLTIGQAPSIVLSQTSFHFQEIAGGANPGGATVQITNGGGATLEGLATSVTYGASQPTGWLTATLSGTTAPSTLTLSAATGALSAGTYTATVQVAASGAVSSPQSIAVTFTLGQAPVLVLTALTSTNLQGRVWGASTGATVQISNGGGGTLGELSTSVTYGASQPTGWLSASFSSTPGTMYLFLGVSDVAQAGHYTATVAVTASGASNSPQYVTVSLTMLPAAIYVSTSDGTDDGTCGLGATGTGSGFHPCRSIGWGLVRANSLTRTEVLVADGVYDESVQLTGGISLLGGYNPATWERHLPTTNTIVQGVTSSGNHDLTVVAQNVTTNTVFEGFVVRGSLNPKTSGNSYAIYVSNSNANLVIRGNVIQSGRGGPGAPGASGTNGRAGVAGTGRSSDPAAYDAKIATGTGSCNASNDRSYANGGVSVFGSDVSGGNGGGDRCPPSSTLTQLSAYNGLTGRPGAPAGGGGGAGGFDAVLEAGGAVCRVPPAPMGGADGANGSPGAHGGAVTGGASQTGAVVGLHWVGTSGTNGIGGSNGGGGGGGGAGGGAYCLSCAENKDRLGGHGGGGGAGGEGGGGGGGGTAGGGAFGIFVVGGSAPVVTGNAIARGEGGTGGSGGNGSAPGLGGVGAAGGQSLFCTGAGGRGGDGALGGVGSGGGGGSGGASFGIYTSGVGVPNYCEAASNNAISGGAAGPAGSGGGSLINQGGAGQPGALTTCSFN